MKKLFFASAVSAMMLLASCGDGNTTNQTTTTSEATTKAPGADVPGVNDVTVTDHIIIEGRDNLTYDKTLFKIKAGQDVKLTLKNVGTMSKKSMAHNVVILQQNTNMEAFGMTAMRAVETDYIPASMSNDIIAHTKLLGPGESDEISFKIPEPGVYDFICTFPGHFASMRGKL